MKTALFLLKAAISVALVWYLSRKVSFAEAASHFSGLRIVPALAAFLLLALSLALGAAFLLAGCDTIGEPLGERFNRPPVTQVFDQLSQVIAERGLTTVTLNDVFTSDFHP